MKFAEQKYTYKHCSVPGGGFVTGFVFSEKQSDVLYARTDIGGMYRYNFSDKSWKSLCDHVTDEATSEAYPLSCAVDEDEPRSLYFACGDHKTGTLAISHDMGESFVYKPIPCGIHGNMLGRGTGERLCIHNKIIWFASQTAGLLRSDDNGDSWTKINVANELNLSFVWVDKREGSSTIVVGTNGAVNSKSASERGHSLYISRDGESFTPLEQPLGVNDERSAIIGFVAQRATFDGTYLYVTFSQSAKSDFGGMNGYTCDNGEVFDGRVYRYKLAKSGEVSEVCDITPVESFGDKNPCRKRIGGLCGIDYRYGMLVMTSISSRPDAVYASFDRGESWTKILEGLHIGKVNFAKVPYMKPEYNGNGSIVHWMTDIKIDPHNPDFAVFNTGTGIFATFNLTNARLGKTVSFEPICSGVEETVHLNVYSPSGGDVKCLDIIGDLGGFAFTDLDKPCENSFADENGNRYITCLNADFTDKNPFRIVATPRGNWTGSTKGGVILTNDQCKSWRLLKYPIGLTERIDKLVENITRPNVDSGWVGITADGERILWAISQRGGFPTDCVVFTDNEGESWEKSTFLDKSGRGFDDKPIFVKIFADRSNPNIVYAFGGSSQFFASTDKGTTFHEMNAPSCFPSESFGGRRSLEIRCEPNTEGVIWIALGEGGLWRITFDGKFNGKRCTAEGDTAKCVGFGKSAEGKAFPTIFTNGRRYGVYGFWRSDDYCESWVRVNDDAHQFGNIISISGDPREYGRFYIATGTRGLLYGEIAKA